MRGTLRSGARYWAPKDGLGLQGPVGTQLRDPVTPLSATVSRDSESFIRL